MESQWNGALSKTDDMWNRQFKINEKLNSDLDEIQEMLNSMMDMIQGLNKSSSSQIVQSPSSSQVAYGSYISPSLETEIQVADGADQQAPLKLEGPKAAHNLFDRMPQLTSANENEGKPSRFPTAVPNNDEIDIIGMIGSVDDKFPMYLKSRDQQLKVLVPGIESETKHLIVEEIPSRSLANTIEETYVDDGSTKEGTTIKHIAWGQQELEPPPIYQLVEEANQPFLWKLASLKTTHHLSNSMPIPRPILVFGIDGGMISSPNNYNSVLVKPEVCFSALYCHIENKLIYVAFGGCENGVVLVDNDASFLFDPGGCTLSQMDCESFQLFRQQRGLCVAINVTGALIKAIRHETWIKDAYGCVIEFENPGIEKEFVDERSVQNENTIDVGITKQLHKPNVNVVERTSNEFLKESDSEKDEKSWALFVLDIEQPAMANCAHKLKAMARIKETRENLFEGVVKLQKKIWDPGNRIMYFYILGDKDVLKRNGIGVLLSLKQDEGRKGAFSYYNAHMESLACYPFDLDMLFSQFQLQELYDLIGSFVAFCSLGRGAVPVISFGKKQSIHWHALLQSIQSMRWISLLWDNAYLSLSVAHHMLLEVYQFVKGEDDCGKAPKYLKAPELVDRHERINLSTYGDEKGLMNQEPLRMEGMTYYSVDINSSSQKMTCHFRDISLSTFLGGGSVTEMINCSNGIPHLRPKSINQAFCWGQYITCHKPNVADAVGVFIGALTNRYANDKEEGDVLDNIFGVVSPSVALLINNEDFGKWMRILLNAIVTAISTCDAKLRNYVWDPGLYMPWISPILEDKDVLKGRDLSGSYAYG